MCRMLALRFVEGARRLADELIDSTVEASVNDPYLERLSGNQRHCHGYGFALARRIRGSWEVIKGRFDAAPWKSGEEACDANLKALGEAAEELKGLLKRGDEYALILHSRRTGSEPRGVNSAHPFSGEVVLNGVNGPELFEAYLSHNGGVKKAELAALLGLADPDLYTDSNVLLKFLLSRVDRRATRELRESLRAAIREAVPYGLSSLDMLVMFVGQSTAPMLFAAGYVKSSDENRWAYYEPVLVRGNGLSGYVSSTVRDVALGRRVAVEFLSGRNRFLSELSPNGIESLEV
ncbi:MAG: hypothetical protein NZ988_02440 [Thaumarchaeota archaeon]|nr:hypothetical protein [Candidatus Calditenuaceae archaeon]MDW8186894.1 hypothetical protein [Nitrososphaerota archaeon]